MKKIIISKAPYIVLVFSILMLTACGAAQKIAEVSNATFEHERNDVFEASVDALRQIGFIVRDTDTIAGTIEAEFFNPGPNAREDLFFGYTSTRARQVNARLSLLNVNNGGTRIQLNLTEVLLPSPSQYGNIGNEIRERQLPNSRYYEGVIQEIQSMLSM